MEISDLQNKKTNRRSFLKILGITGITAFSVSVLYPVFSFLRPPRQREVEVSSVSAGKIEDLKKENYKIVRFGNEPVIVIPADDKFIALSARCTHLDCTVQYLKDKNVIWCACHNGKYDLTGRNISGPPPRPLTKYKTIIKGDELLIAKNT
ncbi:MAG TPA: Rieske (2Fe-2S) protein [Ignavibacteriaceae bacterium]|nr:Rieske (2Fe-2S) protein [Ignavibacteriaceae bacterium]